jgi:hypothetical protein
VFAESQLSSFKVSDHAESEQEYVGLLGLCAGMQQLLQRACLLRSNAVDNDAFLQAHLCRDALHPASSSNRKSCAHTQRAASSNIHESASGVLTFDLQ